VNGKYAKGLKHGEYCLYDKSKRNMGAGSVYNRTNGVNKQQDSWTITEEPWLKYNKILFSTQNTNAWRNLKGNQEWTIRRHRQHWAQVTEQRQIKQKHSTETK
jgi:hypothetical protein